VHWPLPAGRPILRAAATLIALTALCACAGPAASLDPSAPCGGQEALRSPGLEPALEQVLPQTLASATPSTRDSGRFCSPAQLGTLRTAGVAELRFAGATWPRGDGGISTTVYEAPGLTLDLLADAFANGAGTARRVSNVRAQESTLAGRRLIRIDAVADERPQVVLLWDDPAGDRVRALLASGPPEDEIAHAADAFFR
jgi:hypothetical protein